jgi:hypothetical protein
MMQMLTKGILIAMALLLLTLLTLVACSDNGKTEAPTPTETPTAIPIATPTETPTPTQEPVEDIVITIGNLTDMTGPAAFIMQTMNMVLDDLVEYFNEENLIPGVELEVVSYDTQYDPAKAIPGYEWAMERGADLIFAIATPAVATLKSRATDDEVVLFGPTGAKEDLTPPGYVFSLGSMPQCDGYTLAKWIAENDPDFPKDRPAKIGGASWADGYSEILFGAMEEYAETHPDQYEWVGGHVTPLGTFSWGPEVEALKGADYMYTNTVMTNFAREYRAAGYTGKFIGAVAHTAMLGQIYDAHLWDEIDGTLILNTSRWWNDEGTFVDLSKDLLYKNHSGEAENIIRGGSGYLGVHVVYQMLEIIRQAVEAVGPENFDSEALYNAAQSFSLTIDGVELYSYTETKRASMNYMVILEARGAEEDLFRVSEWVPIICVP